MEYQYNSPLLTPSPQSSPHSIPQSSPSSSSAAHIRPPPLTQQQQQQQQAPPPSYIRAPPQSTPHKTMRRRNLRKWTTKLLLYVQWTWLSFVMWSFLDEFPRRIYAYNINAFKYQSFLFSLFYVAPFFIVNRVHVAAPFIACLPSVLSLLWKHSLLASTLTLGWGVGCTLLGYAHTWCNPHKQQRELPQYCLINGLMVLLLVRYNWYSINPMWTSLPFAIVSLVLTLIACVVLMWHRRLHDKRTGSRGGNSINGSYLSPPSTPTNTHVHQLWFVIDEEEPYEEESFVQPHWSEVVRSACAFGGMLTLLHMLFSSHATLPRWIGYDPFPSCLLLFIALVVGISVAPTKLVSHFPSWCAFVSGVIMVSFGPRQLGLTGAILLAIVLPSLWLSTVASVPVKHARVSLIGGMIVYLLLIYCTLACVKSSMFLAVVFHSRLWMVPVLSVVLTICGLLVQRLEWWQMKIRFAPRLPFVCMFIVTLFGQVPSSIVRFSGKVDEPKSGAPFIIFPIGMTTNTTGGNSIPWSNPTFTTVQINLNSGYDHNGDLNVRSIIDYVSRYEADVVALQMSEMNYMFLGMNDAVEYIGWELGRYTFSGWSPRTPSWGVALITHKRMSNQRMHALPSDNTRSLHSLMVASLVVPGGVEVYLLATRFSHDPKLRRAQALAVRDIIASLPPSPKILLGDLQRSWTDESLAPVATVLSNACYTVWHFNSQGPSQVGYTPSTLNVTECGYDTSFTHARSSPLWSVFEAI